MESTNDAADFAERIAAAYATDDPVVDIGRAVLGDTTFPGARVSVPLAMCNRHGLIAGATGTGKTVTLQVLAEALSAQGVPVFAADIKGDLSGLVRAAEPAGKVAERVTEMELDYTPTGAPVQFWALGGQGPGVPVRASIGSFGPQLLAKVLGANETQKSSLSLVFHYADQQGLPLLDLIDLTDLLKYLISDEGKPELKTIGGLSSQTAGVLLRKMVELEQQDAELFFGEPEVSIEHLMRTDADGKGIISCLELSDVQDRPKLFSTFLMWLLAELYETLPEAGDLDKPKLVFFFDEAHLLFHDAPKEFVEQVAQTVRLIRSKGVGVFFVTQLPDDVPDSVLSQLGNRVQHALRSYTPRDAKALKAAVSTYPKTDDYDLEEALTQLGIGEAVVTTLGDNGAPSPVAWTKIRPPQSQIGAVDPAEVKALAEASELWATYSAEVDRESARELLAAKMGVELPTAPRPPSDLPPPPAPGASDAPSADDLLRDSGVDPGNFEVEDPALPPPPAATPPPSTTPPPPETSSIPIRTAETEAAAKAAAQNKPTNTPKPTSTAKTKPKSKAKGKDGNAVTDFFKSREGRATVNNVVRGVFDLLKKK